MLPVVVLVSALAAALTLWAVAFAIVDRPVVLRQLIAGAVVEGALVVQAVVVAVEQVSGGTLVDDPVTLWGYLVVALLLLPGAVLIAFAERSRWSSLVLAVAGFTIIVMELRMWQLWQA